MTDETQVVVAPPVLLPPADPTEGRERGDINRRDPREEVRFATPEWRRETTTENDPRKGR